MDLNIPEESGGLRLYRIGKNDTLIACELVMFDAGKSAVDTVLRRAAIAGRVELEGKVENHFADIYSDPHTFIATVALDAKSYSALKNKWMRCRLSSPSPGGEEE